MTLTRGETTNCQQRLRKQSKFAIDPTDLRSLFTLEQKKYQMFRHIGKLKKEGDKNEAIGYYPIFSLIFFAQVPEKIA